MGIAERRYFSIWSRASGGGERYQKLFKELIRGDDKQDPENADPIARHYLYKQILNCLRAFHNGRTPEMVFRSRLDEIEILSARGLYSLAKRQLKKLIKHAEELDAFPYLQLARQWERRLLKRLPGKNRLLSLETFRREELEWKRKQEQENNLQYLNDRMYLENQILPGRFDSASTLMESLPATSENLDTFEAKIMFHFVQAFFHQQHKQADKSFIHFESIIKLWQAHPHRIKNYPHRFALSVADYLANCHQVENYEPFPSLLNQVRKIEYPDTDSETRARRSFFNLELLFHMNKGNWDLAESLVEEKGQEITEGDKLIPHALKISFCLNFAIIYFFREKYSESLGWINTVINEPQSDDRPDLLRFCVFLRCILQIELGETELFTYLLQSAKRNYKTWIQRSEFAKILIKLLESCANQPVAERKTSATLFLKKLEIIIQKNPVQETGFREMKLWSQSMAEGKPISELLKLEKIRKSEYNPSEP